MRLAGKVAIVTGGGSGIGRGIVLAMAREGADVAIPDIQALNAEKVAEEVKALGRKAFALKTDVTSSADVKAMVDRTREGLGKIDILVNNAGMASPPGLPFTNNTEEDWDRSFAVNTKSVFLTSKAVVPYFIERKAGRIINIASIAGPLSAPTMPPYSVAKQGVITFHAHRGQGAGAAQDHRERRLPRRALDRLLAEAGRPHRHHQPRLRGDDAAPGVREARRRHRPDEVRADAR